MIVSFLFPFVQNQSKCQGLFIIRYYNSITIKFFESTPGDKLGQMENPISVSQWRTLVHRILLQIHIRWQIDGVNSLIWLHTLVLKIHITHRQTSDTRNPHLLKWWWKIEYYFCQWKNVFCFCFKWYKCIQN